MYEDHSIRWMMAGGDRYQTADEGLARVHSSAIREARDDLATARSAECPPGSGLVARARAALGIAPVGTCRTTAPDCPVA